MAQKSSGAAAWSTDCLKRAALGYPAALALVGQTCLACFTLKSSTVASLPALQVYAHFTILFCQVWSCDDDISLIYQLTDWRHRSKVSTLKRQTCGLICGLGFICEQEPQQMWCNCIFTKLCVTRLVNEGTLDNDWLVLILTTVRVKIIFKRRVYVKTMHLETNICMWRTQQDAW